MSLLVSLALAAGVALLGYRLVDERDRSAMLQDQVTRLEAENSALMTRFGRQNSTGRSGLGLGARTPVASPLEVSGYSIQAPNAGESVADGTTARGLADGSGRGAIPGPGPSPIMLNAERANGLRDSGTRDAMRREQLTAMHRMYPDLAEALGLNRENADRFVDIHVEQQMRKFDESRQLAASGNVQSSAEIKEMGQRLAASRRDAEQELAAQFGPDVMQECKTYQQGLGVRMELRGLQLELADAGMALTLGQRDDLVAAIVREQQASANVDSKRLTAEVRIAQAQASYQRIGSTARAVLSAGQFERFDARQRQRYRSRWPPATLQGLATLHPEASLLRGAMRAPQLVTPLRPGAARGPRPWLRAP